jgi:oligopeptide transport system substrate-binding protein
MLKKRWLILNLLVMVALLVAGCKAAPAVDEEAQARIAELEAALAEAEQAGGLSDEAMAELQTELDSLKGELDESQAARCTFNAYRMGWVMDWADAGNMVDTVFGADSDFHYTFWQLTYPDEAEDFKALVKEAYRNTDPESRAAQWQEAEKMVVEDLVAVIPIMHYDRTTLVNADANPLFPPFGAPRFADWSFNTDQTVMRWSAGASVPTLDPQRSTDTTSSTVIYQMFDAPYKFDAEGLIQPLAATSYEVSDDGTVYTIHLREDAMWSDGVPVTAQHYADGISRLLSPDMANDYAYVMFDIVGAVDYNAGEVDTLDSVVAVDDYTLQVTLNAALSYFDSILAFSTFHPIRLDVIGAHPDDWLRPGNYVGNGAYVLVEHNPGENLIMEKNPNYWDADNVTIERLEISMIAEPATTLAAFENGELDWTAQGAFPGEDIPRLVDTPEFLLTPRPGVWYLGVNTTAEHTNNLTFRKALASSMDKRLILDEVAEMPWRIDAWGVIPPEIYGYQGQNVGYGFDVTAAQGYLAEYMAEAGIEDAADITVELWYNKSGDNQVILEAVESMWEEYLGITVETVNVEWATYLETLEECNVIGGGGF